MTRRNLIKQGLIASVTLAVSHPLLSALSTTFMPENNKFEVIIIGGSYSGLSAAMALGRSLRNVLIIDSGLPCNRQTPHSHNFITQDGEKPAAIAEKAKEQVLKYDTVRFLSDLAVSGNKTENGFRITTQTGLTFEAKKLIIATGIKDTMPAIRGFADCWGISVVHCPYCHGYELRNRKTAIMANGERAFHLASLVRNLTSDLTLLTSGRTDFKEEQLAKLKRNNIKIIETPVVEIVHNEGYASNILFQDDSQMDIEGIYAAIPFTQHSAIPLSLGCSLNEQGYIAVDAFQKTTIQGIFACGDNSSMMRSVANAVYTGSIAGAIVNKELTDEQF